MAAPTVYMQDGTAQILSGQIGTIIIWLGEIPPAHTVEANGAALSRTAFAKLFSEYGTKYGEGDGSTTFNLPDLRGRFMEGADGDVGAIKAAGLPNINGSVLLTRSNGGPDAQGAFSSEEDINNTNNTYSLGWAGFRITFDAAHSNPIYGAADTVQPPALTAMFCVIYE